MISHLKKARNKQYPAETMTDADYADDQRLLTNPLAQAELLLHNLEQATEDISLFIKANKIGNIAFFLKNNLNPKEQNSKISRPVHIPHRNISSNKKKMSKYTKHN